MEPASLIKQHRTFILSFVFLDQARGKTPPLHKLKSTSGLYSQTSHHSAAEHNVTHVGMYPALSGDLHVQKAKNVSSL